VPVPASASNTPLFFMMPSTAVAIFLWDSRDSNWGMALEISPPGGSILPRHDVVIFDEAHLIEDIATEFFSIKVSSSRITRILNDSIRTLKSARLAEDPYETQRKKNIDRAKKVIRDFFEQFVGEKGRSHLDTNNINDSVISKYHELDSSLESIELTLRALEGREQSIDQCTSRLETARNDLADILDDRTTGLVHWVERGSRSIVLGASPIDVSESFRDGILFTVPTVILTSATLSTGGDFSFLQSRLGIDFDVSQLSVETPFNYKQQSCLYIPSQLPDPRSSDFAAMASEQIKQLIGLTGGGALVLCTSIRNMTLIHDFLKDQTPGQLLLQGSEPKTDLLSKFMKENTSVLVATTSFWQGVDVPGDALRLVIIDKLPFASPGEPVVAARIDQLKKTGGSPFIDYQVPQAALTLKQGFGRLIRTRHDRGIVSILDRRLLTAGYAKTFIDSLPECTQTQTMKETSDWWSSISKSSHSRNVESSN